MADAAAGDEEWRAIEVEQNVEDWRVADDVEGYTRIKYRAVGCPQDHECSKEAWSRAQCWSYESPYKCRCYVARHMHVSAKHYHETDTAKMEAHMCEIVEEIETYQDRMDYARALEIAENQRGRMRTGPSLARGATPPPPPARAKPVAAPPPDRDGHGGDRGARPRIRVIKR